MSTYQEENYKKGKKAKIIPPKSLFEERASIRTRYGRDVAINCEAVMANALTGSLD